MGLVYDRLAWNEVYNKPSPLFESVTRKWSDDFSKRKDVDQRLVDPETSTDSKHGLQRLQTYGHGKAFKFLIAARAAIGSKIFDRNVNKFLSVNEKQTANYDRFIQTFALEDQKRIQVVEREFTIR